LPPRLDDMGRRQDNKPEARRAFTDRLPTADGLAVSPICLGWVGKPGVISAAYDAGINFFFLTADMHWPLYEAARRGLRDLLRRRGVRDRIVVGVVSYVGQPEFCHVPFLEVLEAVPGLRTIDITIIGGVYSPDLVVRLAEYRKHRQRDGGPRHLPGVKGTGATFHDRAAALLSLNHHLVDVAFARYNPDHPRAEQDLLPKLLRRPRHLLFNFNSTRGHVPDTRWRELGLSSKHWRPSVTDHYRFALRHPRIDGLLVGLDNPRELTALSSTLSSPGLSDEEAAYMRDLADLAAGRREPG
jgi:hypothetical protein